MPTPVLSVQASFGYGAGVGFNEVLRVYPNLKYRRYLKSSSPHKTRALKFDQLSQSEYNNLEAFFIARKQASSPNDQFYIYDPNVVDSIDTSGASTTGRHTAIFLDSNIDFSRDDECSWSGSLNVLFLD